MTTYIYSNWKNSPEGYPNEFYSELDNTRIETRKVEIFKDGKLGYASKTKSTGKTRLSAEPVPTMEELLSQTEFAIKEISKQEFETKWSEAIKNR